MGRFIIKARPDGKFQFNLHADNGQVILTSQGYTTRAACDNGIDSVRQNAQHDAMFNRLTSQNGKPYFNLMAANGQVIGTSEMYERIDSMEHGIHSVRVNAPEAGVREEV